MPQGRGAPYAYGFERRSDGSLHFVCSSDTEAWGWLSLPAQHPVGIQTQQFWTSFCAFLFEGGMEEGQWSALTWMDYALDDLDAGHAVRGVYNRIENERGPAFAMTLFDAQDRAIVTMRGRGVVFRNRNFEQWREGSKTEAKQAKGPVDFDYASPESLGLGEGEFAFVGPFDPDTDRIEALVTAENGMPPHNRVISGSGDHVNSTHFGEVTRQALCLITDNPSIQITGGQMHLNRYVELGTPFALRFDPPTDGRIALTLEQLGKDCAEISLRFEA